MHHDGGRLKILISVPPLVPLLSPFPAGLSCLSAWLCLSLAAVKKSLDLCLLYFWPVNQSLYWYYNLVLQSVSFTPSTPLSLPPTPIMHFRMILILLPLISYDASIYTIGFWIVAELLKRSIARKNSALHCKDSFMLAQSCLTKNEWNRQPRTQNVSSWQ